MDAFEPLARYFREARHNRVELRALYDTEGNSVRGGALPYLAQLAPFRPFELACHLGEVDARLVADREILSPASP